MLRLIANAAFRESPDRAGSSLMYFILSIDLHTGLKYLYQPAHLKTHSHRPQLQGHSLAFQFQLLIVSRNTVFGCCVFSNADEI